MFRDAGTTPAMKGQLKGLLSLSLRMGSTVSGVASGLGRFRRPHSSSLKGASGIRVAKHDLHRTNHADRYPPMGRSPVKISVSVGFHYDWYHAVTSITDEARWNTRNGWMEDSVGGGVHKYPGLLIYGQRLNAEPSRKCLIHWFIPDTGELGNRPAFHVDQPAESL